MVLHQAQLAGGLVLVQRQHGNGRGQLAVHVGLAVLCPGGVFKLHHGKHGLALEAGHGGVGHGQQRGAVGRVREVLAFLASHRGVDDGLVVDVVVATRQDGAALAVGHHVARHEERLVSQLVRAYRVVAELDVERGAHGGGGHGSGVGQGGGCHRSKAGGNEAGSGAVVTTAAGCQKGGGSRCAQREHGNPCQKLQCFAAGGQRGLGHVLIFPVGYCVAADHATSDPVGQALRSVVMITSPRC